MWRPFAGSFVEHSLDSFIVKHEKAKSSSVYTPTKARNFSPFQLSQQDLETRLGLFKELKKKVAQQRNKIRKNDENYQQKIEIQLRYKRKTRKTVLTDMKRIKSHASKKKSESLESDQDTPFKKPLKEPTIIFSEASRSSGFPPIRRRSNE